MNKEITPGWYRMRNGEIAYVLGRAKSSGNVIGELPTGNACLWMTDGRVFVHTDDDLDLITPLPNCTGFDWVEPPPEPKYVRDHDGDLFDKAEIDAFVIDMLKTGRRVEYHDDAWVKQNFGYCKEHDIDIGVCMIWAPPGNVEQDANARLIAAAPKLLEALVCVRGDLSEDLLAEMPYINEAIAEAEGK